MMSQHPSARVTTVSHHLEHGRTGEPSTGWLLHARWKNNARPRHLPLFVSFSVSTFLSLPHSTFPSTRVQTFGDRKSQHRAQSKASIRCMASMHSAQQKQPRQYTNEKFPSPAHTLQQPPRTHCRSLALVQSVIHTKISPRRPRCLSSFPRHDANRQKRSVLDLPLTPGERTYAGIAVHTARTQSTAGHRRTEESEPRVYLETTPLGLSDRNC